MAFYRWCGSHSHIEHETGETPKDFRMVQGPEKEWMESAEHQSLSKIRVPSAAISAHINLDFVRGRSLSKIFEDLDISVMPAEQERRKTAEKAERRQRAQVRHEQKEAERKEKEAERKREQEAEQRAAVAWDFAEAIEPRNEQLETEQIDQRNARKHGGGPIAPVASIHRWLEGIID
ncbi:MAG: hypothetical protein LQ350_004970 [Teloschistes chrysophthalmus]|nr:MAG: hypothetical protein LQ350_004970 [Niorma chrysophthalma]